MRYSLLQVICNFHSVCIYVLKLFCLYRVNFMINFILYFHVLFGLYLHLLLKWFILMTYFDCFGLVGTLEFPACAVKTSKRQYFLGNMTWLQVFLFNKYFETQTTSHKNSIKHNLLKFSLKKNLKIALLRTPPPSFI